MDQSVHGCVRVGVVLEQVIPGRYRQLRYDDRRFQAFSGVDQFKQVPAFVDIKLHQPEVIDRQHIIGTVLLQRLFKVFGDLCSFQFMDNGRCLYVSDMIELPYCTYA